MKKVYLVGAGPGDPDLLTLKGKRVLEGADCVLYDNLANTALLALAAASAERIYVGKKKTDHSMPQDAICNLLVERGRAGLQVVRLKGGDPFLFGRGGEEAEALADAGVAFEVVPGVTSPLGIGAYTGVPLTHRDHTSVVTFITGHDVEKIDFSKVGTAETLVVFMGLSYFDEIARRVIASGRSAQTPAMAVRWGTLPEQKTIVGTLETLPRLVHESGMKPPATFVIGEVVELNRKLNWFETLPLFGKTVVVTRPREQAEALSEPLRQLGANVIDLPAIEITQAHDRAPLDRAIEELPSYHWLVFTSANGVRFFFDRLDSSRLDARNIRGRICAIGPATRAAVQSRYLKSDLMPDEYVAEGLLKEFERFDIEGQRILLARAAVARDVLPNGLRARGAQVDVAEAYRTVTPANLAAQAKEVFRRNPDWVLFTSSSAVQNLADAAGRELLASVKLASIGPVTSETVRRNGLRVNAEAVEYTSSGLISALLTSSL